MSRMPDLRVFMPGDYKEFRFFKWIWLLLAFVFIALAMILRGGIFGVDGRLGVLDWFFWWPTLLVTAFINVIGLIFSLLCSLVWWLFLSAVIADIVMVVRRSRLEKRTLAEETD